MCAICNWLNQSFFDFFTKENSLLHRRLREECINHRLAYWLEVNRPAQYHDTFVDIEFNKNGYSEKTISINNENKHIRPDIIIHRRTEAIGNLIAFECKKNKLSESDKIKLRALKKPGFNYEYCIGICYLPKRDFFYAYKFHNDFKVPVEINKKNIDFKKVIDCST